MVKAETAYRTITEVAELLQVQASVLRYWESQFQQIKPVKRMGRRYYAAEDVVLLARIRDFLYKEGFTIKGVQKRLKEEQKTAASPVAENQRDFAREIMEIRDFLADSL